MSRRGWASRNAGAFARASVPPPDVVHHHVPGDHFYACLLRVLPEDRKTSDQAQATCFRCLRALGR